MPDFDCLEDYKPLFSTGIEIQHDLETGNGVSKELVSVFKKYGIRLSQSATISCESKGSGWLIIDNDKNKKYAVRRKKNNLAIYENLHVVTADDRAQHLLVVGMNEYGGLQTIWSRLLVWDSLPP